MQALRLARSRVPVPRCFRCLSTTATGAHSGSSPESFVAPIPLSNVEAQWEKLNLDEQVAVHRQLEQIQKKDWKELSIDEKKAAYYVAFGPHGPRTPLSPPGSGYKVLFGTLGLLGASYLVFVGTHSFGNPPPKTLTKEWQTASNERAREMKLNPISGVSSEDYQGKGFVTTK